MPETRWKSFTRKCLFISQILSTLTEFQNRIWKTWFSSWKNLPMLRTRPSLNKGKKSKEFTSFKTGFLRSKSSSKLQVQIKDLLCFRFCFKMKFWILKRSFKGSQLLVLQFDALHLQGLLYLSQKTRCLLSWKTSRQLMKLIDWSRGKIIICKNSSSLSTKWDMRSLWMSL